MRLWESLPLSLFYATLNNPASLLTTMTYTPAPVSDIEKFAEYLGLNGIDADLFYESYCQLDEYDDYDCAWDEMSEYPYE